MSEFTVRENDLAEASGISKYILKKTRGELLERDVDYTLEKNALVLTPDAALRVLDVLEVSSPANLLERLSGGQGGGENEKKGAPGGHALPHEWNTQLKLTYDPKKSGGKVCDHSSPTKKGGRLGEPSLPLIAEVVKLPYNTRIVEGVLEGTGLIRVRVRDSRMFVKGQLIPVEKTTSAVWKLAAPMPRRKGRIPGFDHLRKKTAKGA